MLLIAFWSDVTSQLSVLDNWPRASRLPCMACIRSSRPASPLSAAGRPMQPPFIPPRPKPLPKKPFPPNIQNRRIIHIHQQPEPPQLSWLLRPFINAAMSAGSVLLVVKALANMEGTNDRRPDAAVSRPLLPIPSKRTILSPDILLKFNN